MLFEYFVERLLYSPLSLYSSAARCISQIKRIRINRIRGEKNPHAHTKLADLSWAGRCTGTPCSREHVCELRGNSFPVPICWVLIPESEYKIKYVVRGTESAYWFSIQFRNIYGRRRECVYRVQGSTAKSLTLQTMLAICRSLFGKVADA